ncbi:hypothetical protein PHLCEN_2v6117 [Hermanssonia centrifuga]|uniref:Fungal-type protein kinase domain-containing protein n=1 Tax=Hermanssonia centrifuga TaxID=98765 RepID=A0A2R6P0D8_9APHY|nr:hypothetical protein PHLCEN_2v6117 [Hermanssonia centrifuga]
MRSFAKHDLQDSLRDVPLETWIEAVLGVSPRLLNQWITCIRKLNWFRDRIIGCALTDYARPTVTEESDIYKPFARITNRILELAKGTLPGVGDIYPIEDIKVVVNGPTSVERILVHGALGVSRQPDLLFVRGAQKDLSSDIGSRWVDVLAFLEFKLENKDLLIQTLNSCRDNRRPPIIDIKSGKSNHRSKRSDAKPATRRRALVGRASKTSQLSSHKGFNGPSFGGPKRRFDDMLEGEPDRSRGSSKKWKSDSLSSGLAACNALELASCTYGTRAFSLGSIVRDDKMSFWYYDASGYVRTAENLSIMKDLEKFAAIMVAFACGEPKHWGALPDIISPPPSTPYPASFPPPSLKGHSI